jgi:HK97 family phage major capsid protein
MEKNIQDLITEMGRGVQDFQAKYNEKFDNLSAQVNLIENAVARGQYPGGTSSRGTGISDSALTREHKDKFLAWARKGSDPDGLRSLEVQASLSTFSDPDGGYLVPVEMEQSIERLATDAVAMRRLARIVKSTGEYQKPLSKGGATGGWVAEQAARPETDNPELQLFSPPMSEIYAMPAVSQKLLDMSSFDVSQWLIDEILDVFIETEGAGFITGNGVTRVKGIIDPALMVANASWAYGKTGYITSGHATLINDVDRLISLQHSLKPVYRKNATWLMNDLTFETLRTLKDGDGKYIWRPGMELDAPDMLLGKPVEIDDNMPDIGENAYPIAFGDFNRAYTIVDHTSGIRLLRDPFTVKGYVNFYVTKRLAGGISNYEAVKFLKVAE